MIKIDDNISLRAWRHGDQSDLVKHANNIKIAKNLRDGFPFPYLEKDADEWIELSKDKTPWSFAIIYNKEAIGGIGTVRGLDIHSRTAELGYWLAEPFWNKGIIKKVIKRYVKYIFNRTDIIRIYALPFSNNIGSIHVLKKNGFNYEGTLKCNVEKWGEVLDQEMYAIIKGV